MTLLDHETGELVDRMLDALDEAPGGHLTGEAEFSGRLATVQWLSARLQCSDTTTRKALRALLDRGLVQAFTGTDPDIHCRRIYVTGGA